MDESESLPPPPADEGAPAMGEPAPGMAGAPPMAPMGPPIQPSRPGTVTIAAILMIVFGLLATLGVLANLVLVPPEAWDAIWTTIPALGILFYFVLILSILQLVFGAALLTMKSWAWMGALVVQLIHLIAILGVILVPVLLAVELGAGALAGPLFGLLLIICSLPLIIDLVTVILLLLPGSRLAFA